ncbi:MAG: acetyl-CoA carboxylase biotin carboxyl carrier protein [Planctomycetes bacterium]|jgi:acetyl-CoA carboxylase biotin carboxyl carrier protein|nr:acetyl-CoA carboxylase biotin carboxyl carrier protein [Planctomycetota bacterium]
MDLKEIERILELMRQHDLVEVELSDPEKGLHLKMKKAGPVVNSHPVAAPLMAVPTAMAAAPVAMGGVPVPAEKAEKDPRLAEVPSPMVGTFYRASSPDSNPFVEVGQRIAEETVICIIEAMKVMNEIKAEVGGEVVEILVQNGEAVEFGQPLFLIRKD